MHSTVYPYALTKKGEKNRYLGAYPTHMIQGPFKTQITVRQHGKQFGETCTNSAVVTSIFLFQYVEININLSETHNNAFILTHWRNVHKIGDIE